MALILNKAYKLHSVIKLIIKTNGHVFPVITTISSSNENLTTCSSVCDTS